VPTVSALLFKVPVVGNDEFGWVFLFFLLIAYLRALYRMLRFGMTEACAAKLIVIFSLSEATFNTALVFLKLTLNTR
jgi:hypothetical protein